MVNNTDSIVFAGGCFWCTEAIFKMLRGVTSVTPGYTGGGLKDPSYYEVMRGNTGHAESIQIEYDPKVIPLHDLLDVFIHTHDPTSLNRQGADVGPEYRSAIFYTSEKQKKEIEVFMEDLAKSKEFNSPIVTIIEPLDVFYKAEEYHKDYYEKNSYAPYCQIVISPKLTKLREKYAPLLK